MEYSQIITRKEVDKQLSETSENPVQNKIITAALNNLFVYADALPEIIDGCPSIVCIRGAGFYLLYEDANGTKSYKKLITEE